jgi:hypothetical protein
VTDFLQYQQQVLEAHARRSMHLRAQKRYANLAADHASEAQAAQSELDALGENTPSDAEVLR